MHTAPERILLVRTDRIGDAVVSTPLIAMLRERFPKARIDILLSYRNAGIGPLLPEIDSIIVAGKSLHSIVRAIRTARRSHYDVAINLLVNDSASGALLTALCGARTRIGFDGAAASLYDVAVPRPAPDMHMVRATALLGAPLGVEPIGERPGREAERLRLALPEESRHRAQGIISGLVSTDTFAIVALNISTSSLARYWGRDNFIALAGRLREAGLYTLITAEPRHVAEQEAIAHASGATALPVTGSFVDFIAMLDCAHIVLTPDTSVVHIAAALGKPTVMLAAHNMMNDHWHPWGVPSCVLAGNGTITDIDVDAAADALLNLAASVPELTRTATRTT